MADFEKSMSTFLLIATILLVIFGGKLIDQEELRIEFALILVLLLILSSLEFRKYYLDEYYLDEYTDKEEYPIFILIMFKFLILILITIGAFLNN